MYSLMTRVSTNFQNANAKELKILTYEIKNPLPRPNLWTQATNMVLGLPLNNVHSITRKSQKQQPMYPGSRATSGTHIVDMPWNKLQFAVWIEGLKKQYKVGDLVTMALVPVIPNAVPMVWQVTYINELHKDCKYDKDINEPICISVKYPNGVTNQKCPATLRKLTKEELALVNLRNQKPAGSA